MVVNNVKKYSIYEFSDLAKIRVKMSLELIQRTFNKFLHQTSSLKCMKFNYNKGIL